MFGDIKSSNLLESEEYSLDIVICLRNSDELYAKNNESNWNIIKNEINNNSDFLILEDDEGSLVIRKDEIISIYLE